MNKKEKELIVEALDFYVLWQESIKRNFKKIENGFLYEGKIKYAEVFTAWVPEWCNPTLSDSIVINKGVPVKPPELVKVPAVEQEGSALITFFICQLASLPPASPAYLVRTW